MLHRGREIYCNTFGLADAERGYPMKRDTIIRLYSMSKPVTAVAAMILAERGEIDLWDPVSKYLSCFAGQKVWDDRRGEIHEEREVTVYDLLNMTSGITYPDENTEPGRRMGALVEKLVAARERGERVDTRAYMREIAPVPLVSTLDDYARFASMLVQGVHTTGSIFWEGKPWISWPGII